MKKILSTLMCNSARSADKGRLEIDPVSAQQAQGLITDLMGMSPTVKTRLQKMLQPAKR